MAFKLEGGEKLFLRLPLAESLEWIKEAPCININRAIQNLYTQDAQKWKQKKKFLREAEKKFLYKG